MLRHVSCVETRGIYWLFMCRKCDIPLITRDLVVDDFGNTSCHYCGSVVTDANYWNKNSTGTWYHRQSLHVFMPNENQGAYCTVCSDVPYDETDDVTVDNYGNYVCACGGELDTFDDNCDDENC